jgi:hypothetical protein
MGGLDLMDTLPAHRQEGAKDSIHLLRPGSVAAIRAGCCCDPQTNMYGNGVTTVIDKQFAKVYFPDENCPLHSTREDQDDDSSPRK